MAVSPGSGLRCLGSPAGYAFLFERMYLSRCIGLSFYCFSIIVSYLLLILPKVY